MFLRSVIRFLNPSFFFLKRFDPGVLGLHLRAEMTSLHGSSAATVRISADNKHPILTPLWWADKAPWGFRLFLNKYLQRMKSGDFWGVFPLINGKFHEVFGVSPHATSVHLCWSWFSFGCSLFQGSLPQTNPHQDLSKRFTPDGLPGDQAAASGSWDHGSDLRSTVCVCVSKFLQALKMIHDFLSWFLLKAFLHWSLWTPLVQ